MHRHQHRAQPDQPGSVPRPEVATGPAAQLEFRPGLRQLFHALAAGLIRLSRCPGVRASLQAGDLAEYGIPGREQLGRLEGLEDRHGVSGWRIIPVSDLSDGYASVWYPRHRVRAWDPRRWSYSRAANAWTRQQPNLAVAR